MLPAWDAPQSSGTTVQNGFAYRHPLVDVIQIQSGFATAQQQVASAKKGSPDIRHDLLLCLRVEVDQNVAAEGHVERAQGAHALAQVEPLKADHPPHLVF